MARPWQLLCLCLGLACLSTAAGQVQFYNTSNTLLPTGVELYGLAPPANMGDADIQVVVTTTVNQPASAVYCNPAYGQYLLNDASKPSNYPQPGFAVWQSNATGQTADLYISMNDPGYKSLGQYPSFICAVINADTRYNSSYMLNATAFSAATVLATVQQQALTTIYNSCCSAAGSCATWRNLSTNGTVTNTNFCTVLDQACTPAGFLRTLDLSNFNLSCSWSQISTPIATMTSLVDWDMSYNPGLTGSIDDVFKVAINFVNISTLTLTGSTGLKGPLLPVSAEPITTATCQLGTGTLQSLMLANMSLGGTLPACLITSSIFTSLDIVGNALTGTIPDQFSTANALQTFLAFGNNFTGTLPATLGAAKALQTLDLSQNSLNGTIPASFANMSTMQNLLIRQNLLTGTIPSSLVKLPNIRDVDLKQNSFSALDPAYVSGAGMPTNSSLTNFRASFNSIQGSFPTGLMGFPSLFYLILNSNKFSGPLPANSSMFPGLRALNVSTNAFNGTIPAAWQQTGIFQLPALKLSTGDLLVQVFDLTYNRFTGTVPGFLNQTNLENFQWKGVSLAGNSFSNACSPSLTYVPNLCNGTVPTPPPPVTTSATGTGTTSTQSVAPPGATGTNVQSTEDSTPANVRSTSPAPSNGLSTGAIVGIAVAAVVGVVAVAGVVFAVLSRRGGSANVQPGNDAMTSELGRRGSLAQRLKTAGSSGLGNLPSRFSGRGTADSGTARPAKGNFERFNDSPGAPA